jgi:hypothetical protein
MPYWGQVVSFTPRLLYLRGKICLTPLKNSLGGPWRRSGRFREVLYVCWKLGLQFVGWSLCWVRCVGCVVLGALCWMRSAGRVVLDAQCWARCVGCAVLGALCWMRSAGRVGLFINQHSGVASIKISDLRVGFCSRGTEHTN